MNAPKLLPGMESAADFGRWYASIGSRDGVSARLVERDAQWSAEVERLRAHWPIEDDDCSAEKELHALRANAEMLEAALKRTVKALGEMGCGGDDGCGRAFEEPDESRTNGAGEPLPECDGCSDYRDALACGEAALDHVEALR